MDIALIWAIVLVVSALYIGFAIYVIATNSKKLVNEAQKAQEMIQVQLGEVDSQITPAVANTAADLVDLVKIRRARSKQKAAAKAARQRRLVARVRDIEIDKRFL